MGRERERVERCEERKKEKLKKFIETRGCRV